MLISLEIIGEQTSIIHFVWRGEEPLTFSFDLQAQCIHSLSYLIEYHLNKQIIKYNIS